MIKRFLDKLFRKRNKQWQNDYNIALKELDKKFYGIHRFNWLKHNIINRAGIEHDYYKIALRELDKELNDG